MQGRKVVEVQNREERSRAESTNTERSRAEYGRLKKQQGRREVEQAEHTWIWRERVATANWR